MTMRLLILISAVTLVSCWAAAEVDIISEPRPGQEYVFVKASGSGARPITRKEKSTDASNRPFETAHKLPIALTFLREEAQHAAEGKVKEKREAAAPIPAPPGSIKIDPKKLIEKYRAVLEASTKSPTTKSPTTRTTTKKTRTKKEAPTTPNSVLTTGAPPTPRTLHIRDDSAAAKTAELAASASDNKRSRIQIKKGPNGQEYEYEYVYYYYDDEDEEAGTGKGKISNSHDGPARNHISNGRGRHSTSTVHPEPAANEVVPSTRGTRQRGRQLNHDLPEEKVAEERLPQNTRFPPRSRNINTTPAPVEDEVEEPKSRPRIRNRPQGQATDNAADETQVSGRGGGRNRANVRRPSLELVDSASFNTHSSNDPSIGPYKEPKARGEVNVKESAGPSFPSELPEGPVRFLGATPNEKMDLQDLKSRLSEDEDTSTVAENDNAVTTEEVATTETNAMDKVALDLYAILQGTQKLSGEDESSTDESDLTTTESALTTDETTTEVVTTEEITTPTTTTTTTPAPTTTSTTPEPAVTGRGRFRGRPGPGGNRFKSSPSSTTSSPEPSTEKAKSRFSRPSSFGGRARPGQRTTTESSSASEPEVTKEESKPVSSNSKPAIGARNRFSGRTRPPSTTTVSPDSEVTTASSKSGLTRPRPGGSFNLRRRGGATTTKEPTEEESAAPSSEDAPSTTAKSIRGRVNGNLARPLRPGPRIGNLGGRGRLGAATSTTAAPETGSDSEAPAEEAQAEGEEKTGETTPQPASQSPLNKLRNRPKININPARPKTAASAPVQVRRTNPLLARRKPVTPEPSEASPTDLPQEASATEAAAEEDAPSEAPSSTTEEPRGLNKLLAGRRRLVGRTAAVNH